MTVPKNSIINNYKGNGITTQFDFDFLINKKSELLVLHTNSVGTQTILTLDVDYSINKVGNPNGSYIIFPLEDSNYKVLQSNETITLTLNLEIEQDVEYSNSSQLNLETLEYSFDYLVRLLQIMNRKLERCLKTEEGTTSTVDEFLNALVRAQVNSENSAQRSFDYANSAYNSETSAAQTYEDIQNFTASERAAIANLTENSLIEIERKSSFQTRSIAETVISDVPLKDAGLHLKDGALIVGTGLHAPFVEKIAQLSEENPESFTDETSWQNAVLNYGVCRKYVYDRENNTVRLPKVKPSGRYLIKDYTDNTKWYRIYSDGWCEQGGYHKNTLGSNTTFTINLAYPYPDTDYSFTRTGYWATASDLNTNYCIGVTSKTNSGVTMYSYSTAYIQGFWWEAKGFVEIPDYQLTAKGEKYEYVVIATSTKSQAEIETDNIVNDLHNKADLDLTNCTISDTFIQNLANAGIIFVLETYKGDDGWYRVYSDGWCEQGGFTTQVAGSKTITLLKPYKDTSYSIQTGGQKYASSTSLYAGSITSVTKNTFTYYDTYAYGTYWETKGYIK